MPVFISAWLYAAGAWAAMPYANEPEIPQGVAIPQDTAPAQAYGGWQAKRERVFVIHDLFAMSRDTGTMASGFRNAGFMVDNLGYNPLGVPTDGILPVMVKELNQRMQNYTRDDRLHFVCYALGCVVMHGLIYEHSPDNLGHVLMIAPPAYMQWLVERRNVTDWALQHPRLAGANKHKLESYLRAPLNYPLAVLTAAQQVHPRETVTIFDLGKRSHQDHSIQMPAVSGSATLRVLPVNHEDLRSHPDVIAEAVHYIEHGRLRAH